MWRVAACVVLCLLTACARPVGDLGRAKPDVLHDGILPAIGKARARSLEEPVSNFNLTDDEQEMHDRAWRFLVSQHSADWFFDVLSEWQRTRLSEETDIHLTADRYYRFLRTQDFASSRVRYSRIIQDIDDDRATMPGVFTVICAVEGVDRRRATAAQALDDVTPEQMSDVTARHAENQTFIAWFVRAARYRYESYAYALRALLVETPHEEARTVDQRLSELAVLVEKAERHDFCSVDGASGGNYNGLPEYSGSRFEKNPFTPEPIYRK